MEGRIKAHHPSIEIFISVSVKVHCLFAHLTDFVEQSAPLGLGLWSEQTPESSHHDFAAKWEHFKVKDVDNPVYASRLLASVQSYNSRHL